MKKTLNEVYSSLSARRRYEVWFVRLGLADGSGAWWFRYLLMNPGRDGCADHPDAQPAQVWASWFPGNKQPHSFIQGFPLRALQLSAKGQSPFQYAVGENAICENACRGHLNLGGHEIAWNLQYSSTFNVTLSDKGWIGFSRTPHSDAAFSGEIIFDGRKFTGQPIGFGVQGHNCGYRHRKFWRWTHAYFPRPTSNPSTFEALAYEMPLGLLFRKAVLWHDSKPYVYRQVREVRADREKFEWELECVARSAPRLKISIEGGGASIHRLAYQKTDCTGAFEVVNNSLAKAAIRIERQDGSAEDLQTSNGAILEIGGPD